MSRTLHHRQKRRHAGEDMQSKRLHGSPIYCGYTKFLTIRKERALEARLLAKAKKRPETL